MTTYALNLETNATTQYGDSFDFNSLTQAHDGRYYAMNASGLCLLDGDDDDGDPIEAMIGLGQSDLGSDQRKRLRVAYLGVESDTPMVLVLGAEGEQYELPARSASDEHQQQRVDVCRGARANLFTLDLYNSGGSDFKLSALTVVPAASANRRFGS
jgi:hypothetical protein